jgi:aspartyl-tRNA synthetase
MRTLSHDTTTAVGQTITLQGWIHTIRKHGKILFIDVRDFSGIVQTVVSKDLITDQLHAEDVVEITGTVKQRPESMVNSNLSTGTVEVEVSSLHVLNKARELPFPIDTDGYDISEEMRLKYRYLDLRRPRLQHNMRLRSKLVESIRQFLFGHRFTEIETPMLTKSTPEGSRDFLVPSRLQPGKFFALPQSPQQYKQLLMVAAFERYFQIAKCIRDEDTRADRGFEFTQVDLEMSFVTKEDVMALDEAMMIAVCESLGYTIKQKPFPVLSYKEAMDKYGDDKFDMRTDEEKQKGILAFAWVIDFPFFEKTEEGGWTFTHNPFSLPKKEHIEWLKNGDHIEDIIAEQYDLICNGCEVGGGSIRAHKPELLEAVFRIMGYSQERIKEEFGHMLEAFSYGSPPHGGLAHGIERLVMILQNEPYLREVVAFPQSSKGTTSVMTAPEAVTSQQLSELGLQIVQDTDSLFEKIQKDLSKKQLPFELTEHQPVSTSQEAADVRGVSLSTGAKALLFFADEQPVMVVVPGDKKMDMKRFKQTYGIKDLRMATPQEVQQVTTVAIGAVPPFGHLIHIPLYADESIRQCNTIYFNPGRHDRTIGMKEVHWEQAAQPIVGVFVKESTE